MFIFTSSGNKLGGRFYPVGVFTPVYPTSRVMYHKFCFKYFFFSIALKFIDYAACTVVRVIYDFTICQSSLVFAWVKNLQIIPDRWKQKRVDLSPFYFPRIWLILVSLLFLNYHLYNDTSFVGICWKMQNPQHSLV